MAWHGRRSGAALCRTAVWAQRLAVIAVLVTGIAVAGLRMERLSTLDGLSTLAAGLGLAILAMVTAGAAFVAIWQSGAAGAAHAMRALAIVVAVLAYPAWLTVDAVRLPHLSDVTTDVSDPPSFSRSRRAQLIRGGHVPPESNAEDRALQRQHYPELQPIVIEAAADVAFPMVLRAARNVGWQIVEETAPSLRSGVGRVEAVARSPLLRLPDDITIRVRGLVSETRVDLRAASRLGSHDLGANRAHVRRFMDELSSLMQARNG
jgi:uncharacterized protein (DUF1499 family)